MTDYSSFELGDLERENWFAYDGYNPKHTYELMSKIEPDKAQLEKDIKTCIFFVANRGNKPKKASQKMPEKGKRVLAELSQKYKIQDGKPINRETITMVRIAGIMPLTHARFMANTSTRIVGIKPRDLPRCLCFAGAPAIIPNDKESLFESWMEWALSFNRVISAGQDNEKVRMFGKIIQDSGYLDEEQKAFALNALGV
jgi:hypothetical protein